MKWDRKRMRLRTFLWMWWHVKVRPSPMQKEFNRGDPEGKVRAFADQILAELEEDEP